MIACSPRSFARSARSLVPRFLFLVLVVAGMPAPAHAQLSTTSHWGVSVSFTPSWKTLDSLKQVFVDGEGTVEGTEFTIGIARGSMSGGDWSVSYVHKPIKDQTFVEIDQSCEQVGCFTNTRTTAFQDVLLKGVEFVWSKPIVTLGNRVQIGVNVGGGAAWVYGNIEETNDFTAPPGFGGSRHDVFTGPASETLWPVYPQGRVEAMGAFIVAPGFKVKASGGFNFPAASFRVSAVYLIGAK